jgi:hypothetical protein
MNYSSLDNTWTGKTSLHSLSFDPFKDLDKVENYYTTQSKEWSHSSNITPSNSAKAQPIKYESVKNGYMTLDNTRNPNC